MYRLVSLPSLKANTARSKLVQTDETRLECFAAVQQQLIKSRKCIRWTFLLYLIIDEMPDTKWVHNSGECNILLFDC